jgi:uncharacterized membrane protein YgcG
VLSQFGSSAVLTAAHADPPDVTIQDTTGDLDEASLLPRLEAVEFREPVKLTVLTVDVTAYGHESYDDLALNDTVYDFASSRAPELIEGDTFADGVVIIAIDPENRFVGTYAGEDVKLTDSEYEKVQEAMKDPARARDWDEAMLSGTQSYAEILGRPFLLSPGGIVLELVTGTILLIFGGWQVHRTGKARSDLTEGRASFEDVLAKRATLEKATAAIEHEPSSYAQTVRNDAEAYHRALERAQELAATFPVDPPRSWAWKHKNRTDAATFRKEVAAADDADDGIIDAALLLQRQGDWERTWKHECAPLEKSLDSVEQLSRTAKDLNPTDLEHLRTVAAGCWERLARVDADLRAGTIEPIPALEEVDAITGDLREAADGIRTGLIKGATRNDTEEEVMRNTSVTGGFGRDFESSLRYRHASRYANDQGRPEFVLNPVLYTIRWSTAADNALHVHRNPPSTSSTGSSSGFSSSSGGFSGSGSSSRF